MVGHVWFCLCSGACRVLHAWNSLGLLTWRNEGGAWATSGGGREGAPSDWAVQGLAHPTRTPSPPFFNHKGSVILLTLKVNIWQHLQFPNKPRTNRRRL